MYYLDPVREVEGKREVEVSAEGSNSEGKERRLNRAGSKRDDKSRGRLHRVVWQGKQRHRGVLRKIWQVLTLVVCIAWVVVVDDVVVDAVIVVVCSVVFLCCHRNHTPTDKTFCVRVWLVNVCSCPLNTLVLEYCVVV